MSIPESETDYLYPINQRENENVACGAFKSAGHAQRFLATFGVIASLFRPGRHLLAARNYREIMRRRFAEWSQVTDPHFAIQ
jgi:putative transposase